MKKYTRKEYEKYVKEMPKRLKPVSFEDWKIVQPLADESLEEIQDLTGKPKED